MHKACRVLATLGGLLIAHGQHSAEVGGLFGPPVFCDRNHISTKTIIMTNRHPILVLVLSFFTCGIYYIYWLVVSKIEMNNRGADIPTAWLLIIPFVNIYWLWRWSQGVEKVTNGALTAVPTFLLCWVIAIIGGAIIQSYFNKVTAA